MIPSAICECLAFHEAFRRLNFSSNDIFVYFGRQGVKVVLRTQGKEFVVAVDDRDWPCGTEERIKQWSEAVRAWNGSMTDAERKSIYESCVIGRATELIVALDRKGIKYTTDKRFWN